MDQPEEILQLCKIRTVEGQTAQRPILLADMGEIQRNHENLPHCMAKGVPNQRLLKNSEFSVEEPIALIGHDGFCEGL